MRIIRLSAENVKRLVAVDIRPDGNLVIVGGKNGHGKSSCLDAIAYALGGEKLIPGQPVRKGQDKAKVTVELDDLTVTRTFTAAGGGSLVVANKDGARYPSPQAILDRLVGRLSFDPLEFARMDPAHQRDTLRRLAGLDFTEMDRRRLEVYHRRTEVNRQGKLLEHKLAETPSYALLPDAEVSLTAITEELAAATAAHAVVTELQADLEDAHDEHRDTQSRVERAVARIAELEQQLAAAKADHARVHALAAEVATRRTELDTRLDAARAAVPDLLAIRQRLDDAEATNDKVRANTRRAEVAQAVADNRKESEQLTTEIGAADKQKLDSIAAAKFPIDGLSVTDEGVTFDGFPFDQASGADRLRISTAIGIALNPKLKVLLIRDGSALDSTSLALMATMAADADAQVWLEKVAETKEGVSVLIEDGTVKP